MGMLRNLFIVTYKDIMNNFSKKILFISVVLISSSLFFTCLHYKGFLYGNNYTWILWLASLIFLFFSLSPKSISIKKLLKRVDKGSITLVLFIFILYWVSHLWNFSNAPWNQNGLFDDAAWDIYFSNNHAFKSPFQAAFFDEVGYISREVVFHYYITFFFELFGYNLLVFNFSLLVLGFITVLFTTLIIHRLFGNIYVTLISALIINFFPLHYTHIFMGHRYAIAAPLMVISLYFIYTSFAKSSFISACISAFFAALTWGSSIMGKQYILALLLSLLLTFIFSRRIWKSKKCVSTVAIWSLAFFFSSLPLVTYILFNYDLYFIREKGLLGNFFQEVLTGGASGLKQYTDQIIELFFAKITFKRQFLPDFYIIPLSYYTLLIPGLFIALTKKRYEIVLLSLIPTASALVSGAYDFRVLLSVPIWVIAISFTINCIFSLKSRRLVFFRGLLLVITLLVLLFGLLPSIKYLWGVSKDTNHFYLLPHKDVAFLRLVQDIAAGSENPNSEMKKDEFNRNVDMQKVSYDTLVCPHSAYAIAHLYLQKFDNKKTLSFCNQGIQLLKTSDEIVSNNIDAIRSYKPDNKDLKLVWEVSEKSKPVVERFKKYVIYGSDDYIADSVDDTDYTVYILTIGRDNIESLQEDLTTAP